MKGEGPVMSRVHWRWEGWRERGVDEGGVFDRGRVRTCRPGGKKGLFGEWGSRLDGGRRHWQELLVTVVGMAGIVGIEGIVVGIVGIDGILGNGGSAMFGMVGMEVGNGGNVGFGRDGLVGRVGRGVLGSGGSVAVGRFGIAGRGGNVALGNGGIVGNAGCVGREDCNRWRAARAEWMLLESETARIKNTKKWKSKAAIG
ncbi:hypothetical protein Salat_2534300 [Sesamum alatum]|uniref:Uncharacterized protein n=1 Tax=Sesamum alatum TaxID=300844 RepID=A0AAE1XT61_9LAMI|nr:hypothetical protein Salat_2534300 [Sesamum alatum]